MQDAGIRQGIALHLGRRAAEAGRRTVGVAASPISARPHLLVGCHVVRESAVPEVASAKSVGVGEGSAVGGPGIRRRGIGGGWFCPSVGGGWRRCSPEIEGRWRQFGEEKEESRDRGCGRGVGGEVLFSHGKLLSAHKRTIWLMLTVGLSLLV